MTEPYGDPDLATLVGLTGGERITPQQAEDWLQRPTPKRAPAPPAEQQRAPSADNRDLVQKWLTGAAAAYSVHGSELSSFVAAVANDVATFLSLKDARIARLTRELDQTLARLEGDRRITAAYSEQARTHRCIPLAGGPDSSVSINTSGVPSGGDPDHG